MNLKRQSFLKGSAVLIFMVLVTKIIGMVYKIPLTSMLGGSGMSCYSGAFAVFTPVFAAAAAGVPSAMSRLISEQLAIGSYRNALRIKRTALLIFSAISIILSVALIVSANYLAVNVIHIPQARWAVIGVSFSLFPAAVINIQRGWTEGLGSMTPTAESEITETIFKLIFGLTGPYAVIDFAMKSFEQYHGCFGKYCSDTQEVMLVCAPYAAAASVLGIALASAAASLYLFFRSLKINRTCEREYRNSGLPLSLSHRQASVMLMKFAVPASITAVAATLAGTADLVTITPLLQKAMDSADGLFDFLGAYGIPTGERAGFIYGSYTGLALIIFGLVPTFTAMLGKSILPSLTASCIRGDREEAGKGVRSLLLLSGGLAIPSGLGICVLARPILRLFFAGSPAECAVSAAPLSILGIGVIFMGISLPCLTALQACSRQVAAVGITLFGAVLKLALNIILIPIPEVNICGAALSTTISQAVICIWSVALLIRSADAGKEAVFSLFTPLIPSAMCAFSAALTQQQLANALNGGGDRFGVLISVAVGAIIYLFSIGLLCIMPKNQIGYNFSEKIKKNS